MNRGTSNMLPPRHCELPNAPLPSCQDCTEGGNLESFGSTPCEPCRPGCWCKLRVTMFYLPTTDESSIIAFVEHERPPTG